MDACKAEYAWWKYPEKEEGIAMKIKYAAWEHIKIGRKKHTKVTTGEIEWSGVWEGDHTDIRKTIHEKELGKHIMGYCPAEKWGEFTKSINENNADLNLA